MVSWKALAGKLGPLAMALGGLTAARRQHVAKLLLAAKQLVAEQPGATRLAAPQLVA